MVGPVHSTHVMHRDRPCGTAQFSRGLEIAARGCPNDGIDTANKQAICVVVVNWAAV